MLALLNLVILLLALPASALDTPKPMQDFVRASKHPEVLQVFQGIEVVDPQTFQERYLRGEQAAAMASGFNALAVRSSQERMAKLSHEISAAFGLIELKFGADRPENIQRLITTRERWSSAFDAPVFQGLNIRSLRGLDEGIGMASLYEEILGAMIFMAVTGEQIETPDVFSSDLRAYSRPMIPGVSLATVLKNDTAGIGPKYRLDLIWPQVIRFLRLGEKQMQLVGWASDMLTSGNFIVSGTPDAPVVRYIDATPITPSPEAKALYAKRGIKIPEPMFMDIFKDHTVWPNMPEQIVNFRGWGMSFDHALQFVQAFYGTETIAQSIVKLAEIPELPIYLAPIMEDYSNVRRARELKRQLCRQRLEEAK